MPATREGARGAVITGWGSALPEKVVTNHDLEKMFDTNHDWIVDRSGIHQRHVDGLTSALSIESGREALEMSGVDLADIDALVLATTTPDRAVPATASTVQEALGLRCGAFDLNAACSGWVYGLVTAHGLIAMGAEKVLLIGTDTLSSITDWTVDGPGQLLGWDLDSDGSAEKYLYAERGGNLIMEGREVFRRAVRIMVDSATKSMKHAGVTSDDIALVVPHQANIRIISASMDRLGLPMDRASIVLDRTGNTSSASVPLALNDALDKGRINDGDLVLFVGFGAGMSAASAIVRWTTTAQEHTK